MCLSVGLYMFISLIPIQTCRPSCTFLLLVRVYAEHLNTCIHTHMHVMLSTSTRLAEKGMEAEAQQQKGSAAYAKRLKSPWFFQALVPPEDRDTYDKGYSLLPGA